MILGDTDVYEKLTKNPLVITNKSIKDSIRRIAATCPEPKFFDKFIRNNCILARFYGLPKIHKPECPLRPIISNVGTATRSLAGWLASILTRYLGTFSGAHLRNSIHFKEKMVEFAQSNSLNNSKLVSLDVTALYTNVPLEPVLNFIDQKIDAGVINIPIPKSTFLSLIRLCVNNNYFEFNGKFYRQKFGVAMGSPLSPVLANLFMEHYESELVPAIPGARPKLWLRYVDDVLVAWEDTSDFDKFLSSLNSLAPSIKFTVEWEEGGTIPFLDTKVFRCNSHFRFTVYRKPTHAGQYLHYFSWHPPQVKRSVVFSLMLRAHRICDVSFLRGELDSIFQCFYKLGYPKYYLNAILYDVRAKFYRNPRSHEAVLLDRKPTISLPYNNFIDRFAKPVIQSNSCKVAFSAKNTLKSKLTSTNRSSCSRSNVDSGCYAFNCGNCPLRYLGQTGRAIGTRIREHRDCVRLGRENSAVYTHWATTGHEINFDSSALIYKSNSLSNRLIVESALIKKIPNFNNTQGACTIDPLSSDLILKSQKFLNSYIRDTVPG